jgi:hypothetical protein
MTNRQLLENTFIDNCVSDYIQNDALMAQYDTLYDYLQARVQNAIDDSLFDRTRLFNAFEQYIIDTTTDNAHCVWVNEPELQSQFESESDFIDFSVSNALDAYVQ